MLKLTKSYVLTYIQLLTVGRVKNICALLVESQFYDSQGQYAIIVHNEKNE